MTKLTRIINNHETCRRIDKPFVVVYPDINAINIVKNEKIKIPDDEAANGNANIPALRTE